MSLSPLFEVYSRRDQESDECSDRVTREFRRRVVSLCESIFPPSSILKPPNSKFWSDIHEKLIYLYGKEIPSAHNLSSQDQDTIYFLLRCRDKQFLDFVELIFKCTSIFRSDVRWPDIVNNINTFLQVDNLPYFLTNFVFKSDLPTRQNPLLPRRRVVEAYPRIIRRDSEILHDAAIQPTIKILEDPKFSSANSEFLEALTHFRKAEYPDCLSKCGSSLESVMKIICDRKGWRYSQTDSFSKLLGIILDESDLEGFFRDTIMIVGTIRNRLSSAHGAGTQQRAVPKHKAAFAINATASAILLLVEEINP